MQHYDLNAEDCVMIGDRKHDLIGARRNDMDAIGVLYGYGSLVELEDEKPSKIVESVQELSDYLKDH